MGSTMGITKPETESAVRRSSRPHSSPLAYWKGEVRSPLPVCKFEPVGNGIASSSAADSRMQRELACHVSPRSDGAKAALAGDTSKSAGSRQPRSKQHEGSKSSAGSAGPSTSGRRTAAPVAAPAMTFAQQMHSTLQDLRKPQGAASPSPAVRWQDRRASRAGASADEGAADGAAAHVSAAQQRTRRSAAREPQRGSAQQEGSEKKPLSSDEEAAAPAANKAPAAKPAPVPRSGRNAGKLEASAAAQCTPSAGQAASRGATPKAAALAGGPSGSGSAHKSQQAVPGAGGSAAAVSPGGAKAPGKAGLLGEPAARVVLMASYAAAVAPLPRLCGDVRLQESR